jgi:membrane-bound lytic murein transglycosylase A
MIPALAGALLLVAGFSMLELKAEPAPGDARLEPVGFDDLAGWSEDDHGAAFAVFRRSCVSIARSDPVLRPASAAGPDLRAACAAALALPNRPASHEARRFFETHFQPVHVRPGSGSGFLTGYFEPEYEGSMTRTAEFQTPLLARPEDLVTVPQGESLPGLDPGLQAARRTDTGFAPYPDRAAIEDGALGELARPIVFLRDAVEAFVIHVQGSARIRLSDGTVVRVAYAGRNGRPYTSIGRLLVEQDRMGLEEMSLERLMAWIRANPRDGRELMRRNRSYIFFRIADELDPADGPIGGAGIPLAPGRSLAVDRTLWSYGLPFWLEGELPLGGGGSEPLRRLMIAQDTGSAIVGPARGDYFFGSGADAGTRAGLLRHPTRFVVLSPKAPG